MIKQSITKYNEPVWNVHYNVHHQNKWTSPNAPTMGKLEYAMYLRNLPIKKGMLVVNKVLKDTTAVYSRYSVYRVKDILEIHRYVNYYNQSDGPLCLVLEGLDGRELAWKGGGNAYVEAEIEKLPQEWKDANIVNLSN